MTERLQPPSEETWSAWSSWCRNLLDRYLLPNDDRRPWPESEAGALRLIHAALDDLAALDALGLPPTLATFEATVLGDLSATRLPGRLQGPGLFVGPLSAAPGLSFERIVVVGLAEGRFPRVLRGDSLLTDSVRAGGHGMLAETSEATHLDTRSVALAVAASVRPALLLTARGDLRSNRSRAWPRVLDGLVEARQSLHSHHQGLLDHGRPISEDDLGLRSLVSHVDGDDPVHTHPLSRSDAVLAANLGRRDNLERQLLTRHDGRVTPGLFDPTEHLLSPTALETYAACPRKYLFQRVLRLVDDERPERIDEITARDRGTLMHHILERFVADALEEGAVPAPGQPWPTERRARLLELMEEAVAGAQARGITGGEVRTRLLRRRLHTELLNFLDTDDELRAERRSTPFAVEYGFGLSDENSALSGQWAGREMRLRGSVDRVDFTDDGGLLVIDYKGGSGRAYAKLEENPLDNGRRLQLPLYARAVAEKLSRDGDRTGLYWLTKENKIREMSLDQALEHDLEQAVGAALDGIADGLFPAVPGEAVGWPRLSFENCRYCDFDRVCPTNRQSEWERVRADAALSPINLLIGEPEDPGGSR
jgi:RecB family exonuclease